MQPSPRIACLDLDTFFVSVERLLDPRLNGKEVVVGATGDRGVVTACSYEVRAHGVRSGMPISRARRLAPRAIYLPTRHKLYSPYARQVKAVIERFTPSVQTASIDEFYLDFAGCEKLYARAADVDADATIERTAHLLRQTIQDEIGLPASIGLGCSRSLAKMASGRAKPAGVWMVRYGQERAFFEGLPVRKLPGIGPKTEERLLEQGILTLDQLIELPPGPIRARFGDLQRRLVALTDPQQRARLGRDRPAFREHDPDGLQVGSISNERTFHADVDDERKVADQLLSLCERVCWRARKRNIRARTVTLKLRYSDFTTLTRSRTGNPTNLERQVHETISALYGAARSKKLPVRLLGVGLSNLVGPERQLSLPFVAGQREAGAALDQLRQRFGYDAVRVGATGTAGGWIE
jgi:DNA polymerase-4